VLDTATRTLVVTEPVVVFEVLGPSTASIDHFEKETGIP